MAVGPIVSCHCLDGLQFYTVFEVLRRPTVHWGAGQLSRYSDSLRVGRSGDRIPVGGARFSAPVQTGPGDPPSLPYNGYRVFPGGKAAGAWR
jgi:hypothetical protein